MSLSNIGKNLPIVTPPKINYPIARNYQLADYQYEVLTMSIIAFEKDLDEDEEVGARLVFFGQSVTFHITDIGYSNPSIITFSGLNEDNKPVKLIQHISQISVLLTVLPRADKTRERIGFKLQNRAKSESKEG